MGDYEILVKGNSLAKVWARKILGRRKLGAFINVILRPQRAETLRVSRKEVEEIQSIPSDDRNLILATQEVTGRVFARYDKLAIRIARRFATGVGRDNDADVTQLESEARVGLLKAIRGYSNIEIKFITYAHRAIQNEVSRYIQRHMGIGLTGVNATLLVRYKRKLEELTKASLPHGLEDVCRELDLTGGQISRLRDALRAEVTSESEMEDSLSNLLVDGRHNTKVDLDLIDRLQSVAMTKLETYSWYSQSEDVRSLFPEIHCDCEECRDRISQERGFNGAKFQSLKDVAVHFGVTPQAASEALKRAQRKLAVALGNDWNPGI